MKNIISLLTVISLSIIILHLPIKLNAAYRSPAWSKTGMVATPHWAATDAGVEILENGGNAFDAAVAAAYALSVVEQYHSGIGGGEFALIRVAKTGEIIALDARESAPAAATADMYLDPETGEADSKKSYRGGLAVGVPGSVAGRAALLEKYGNLSHSEVIEPAVRFAGKGFLIDRIMASRIARYQDRF